MLFSRAVAALAIDRYLSDGLVLSVHTAGMTEQTVGRHAAGESHVGFSVESGRHVPPACLRVERDGRLVQPAPAPHQECPGVVTRLDRVAGRAYVGVHDAAAVEEEFFDPEFALPVEYMISPARLRMQKLDRRRGRVDNLQRPSHRGLLEVAKLGGVARR